MLTVLLVLQVIITASMIIVILIQRSASDGMAGLAGGGNSIMSGRASANLLTRITSILAAIFIANSLAMAAISARSATAQKSVIDEMNIEQRTKAPAADETLKKEPADATSGAAKPASNGKPAVKEDKESKPVVPIAE